ncbi:MAG: hypothetical protein EOO85_15090 [Pedobacter sp.]|nr:MAG: hypothetical protein EOO85_15090 [Pedobacter sp.]
MIIFFFCLLFVAYMIYGIVHLARNKFLPKFEKLLWLILIICMPVFGTSTYLHSTFVPHRRQW